MHTHFTPKLMVEWVTHLFRIRDVFGSHLGTETGCPNMSLLSNCVQSYVGEVA